MNSTAADLSNLRILLVEDEMMLAMLMEDWLETLDCEVTATGRLQKALDHARDEAFDGALLDVNLAGEECYPLAESLDEQHVPFILMTGYTPDMLRADFAGRPMVSKPFQLEAVEQLMSEVFVAA